MGNGFDLFIGYFPLENIDLNQVLYTHYILSKCYEVNMELGT